MTGAFPLSLASALRSELAHSDLHGVYSLDYRTTHLATSIPASPTPSARAFASLPSPPPSTSTSSQSLSTAYPDASASTTSRHSRRSKHRQRSESSTLQGSSVYAQEDLPGVWPIEGWRQLSGYVFAASIGIGVRLVSLFSSTWRAGKHWAGGLVTDGRLARRLSLERSSRPSSWAFAGANTCMLVAQELSPSVANPPARVSRGCDLDLFSPVLHSFSSRSFRTSPSPSFVSVWCSPLFSSPCPFGVVVSPPRSAVSVAPFVPPRLDRRPVFRLRLCRQLQCVHIHSVRLSQLGAAACDEGCGGSGGSSGASRGGEGLIGSPSISLPRIGTLVDPLARPALTATVATQAAMSAPSSSRPRASGRASSSLSAARLVALVALAGSAQQVHAAYSLTRAYSGSSFLDGWSFYGARAPSLDSPLFGRPVDASTSRPPTYADLRPDSHHRQL